MQSNHLGRLRSALKHIEINFDGPIQLEKSLSEINFEYIMMAAFGSTFSLFDGSLNKSTSSSIQCGAPARMSLRSCKRTSHSCRKVNILHGYYPYNVVKRSGNNSPFEGFRCKDFHTLSCSFANTSPDGQLLKGISWKNWRWYSSRSIPRGLDWKKLRPMIMERIENRAKNYPVKPIVPVAQQVLKARSVLYRGVSLLLHHIPLWTCQCCSEVYVGESGHLIRTCRGYRRGAKKRLHKWIKGSLNDILIPVETFRLQENRQKVVNHNERFDCDRISAVVELCLQAGAEPSNSDMISGHSDVDIVAAKSLSEIELRVIARETLEAWETFRFGVQRLLFVYPAKVCKYCSEVHVGISGHKARICGVFKFESFHGTHHWEKAKVDDLVPPKIAWFRRPQDPPLLLDEGRNVYGHAPAVVDLCSKAGAIVSPKYHCVMKINGLTAPMRCRDTSGSHFTGTQDWLHEW